MLDMTSHVESCCCIKKGHLVFALPSQVLASSLVHMNFTTIVGNVLLAAAWSTACAFGVCTLYAA